MIFVETFTCFFFSSLPYSFDTIDWPWRSDSRVPFFCVRKQNWFIPFGTFAPAAYTHNNIRWLRCAVFARKINSNVLIEKRANCPFVHCALYYQSELLVYNPVIPNDHCPFCKSNKWHTSPIRPMSDTQIAYYSCQMSWWNDSFNLGIEYVNGAAHTVQCPLRLLM